MASGKSFWNNEKKAERVECFDVAKRDHWILSTERFKLEKATRFDGIPSELLTSMGDSLMRKYYFLWLGCIRCSAFWLPNQQNQYQKS